MDEFSSYSMLFGAIALMLQSSTSVCNVNYCG